MKRISLVIYPCFCSFLATFPSLVYFPEAKRESERERESPLASLSQRAKILSHKSKILRSTSYNNSSFSFPFGAFIWFLLESLYFCLKSFSLEGTVCGKLLHQELAINSENSCAAPHSLRIVLLASPVLKFLSFCTRKNSLFLSLTCKNVGFHESEFWLNISSNITLSSASTWIIYLALKISFSWELNGGVSPVS